MRIGIISGGVGWHVQDLVRAATQAGHLPEVIDFRRIGSYTILPECNIIRTMPVGSLEQIVFRMDLLHQAMGNGIRICNSPKVIETCVDKFLTDTYLSNAGLQTPTTMVYQTADDAMIGFEKLGNDVVVKPLFGSEGRGMMRITDRELAWRSFRAIEQLGGILYLQQYIQHPGWDYRIFVLNHRVIASMRRIANGDWRTNIAQGGFAECCTPPDDVQNLAIRATQAVSGDFAGVDILPGPQGEWYVIEVNGVPGWRALSHISSVDIASKIINYVTR